jgi:hypothetical protein
VYQDFNWLIGIGIGVILIIVGYYLSFFYLPKKAANPDITLLQLKYLYLESFTLIIGGLFLVTLSLLLTIV